MTEFVSEFRSLDNDATLSANSNYRVASQKAVKTYVDRLKGAIDWLIQDYTVQSGSKTLSITLNSPCYFVEGLFAFYQGKTLIPNSCLSLNENHVTLTITSNDYFNEGDLIQLRWANVSTEFSYVKVPTGVDNNDIDFVIEYGVTNGVWYKVYKSGWLEQGGVQTGTGSYGLSNITLAREYNDTNYTVTANIQWASLDNTDWYTNDSAIPSSAGISDVAGIPCDKSTTSFKLQSYSTHAWVTRGQKKSS